MKLSLLVKEPLCHFLAISALLFVVYDQVAPEPVAPSESITISDARIEQMYNRFEKLWHRPPSDIEMTGLIDDYLLDEIYALEARELGLDKGDGVIKKRLRQKMEFMLFDIAGAVPPKKHELQEYLEHNAERYTIPESYDLEVISLDKDASVAEKKAFKDLTRSVDDNSDFYGYRSYQRFSDAPAIG
ncbi:hypothetical protein [Vibrio variabilis]|uniref:hypothetical protein n=1 Tax=Vibrio variabilis TaxID=990271 RepID=UPI000DD92008|nr:hypothetical protein [Vibrio variabilis]